MSENVMNRQTFWKIKQRLRGESSFAGRVGRFNPNAELQGHWPGHTILYDAVLNKEWDVAAYLVKQGADLYIEHRFDKENIVQKAFNSLTEKNDACADFLKICASHGLRHTQHIGAVFLPWQKAAERGNPAVCDVLINAYEDYTGEKAYIDASVMGKSLLCYMLQQEPENRKIISYLLSKGADPEKKSRLGLDDITCYDMAALQEKSHPGISAFFNDAVHQAIAQKAVDRVTVPVTKARFKAKRI